jgi:hypothetical protein
LWSHAQRDKALYSLILSVRGSKGPSTCGHVLLEQALMRSESAFQIALFDAKSYDMETFNEENKKYGFEITYFEARLKPETVDLAMGYDVVCVFVNDEVNETVVKVCRVDKYIFACLNDPDCAPCLICFCAARIWFVSLAYASAHMRNEMHTSCSGELFTCDGFLILYYALHNGCFSSCELLPVPRLRMHPALRNAYLPLFL